MLEHGAETDALTQQLVTAGLLELFTDDDGQRAMCPAPDTEES